MRKQSIEVRRYSEFSNALDDLIKLNAAGYHADLKCLDEEPKGFGFNLGYYYELAVFRWSSEVSAD